MRRLQIALIVVVLPLLVISLTLSGCKPPANITIDDDEGSGVSKGSSAAKLTAILMGKGTIKGKVVLKGIAPDRAQANAALKAQIEGKDDRAVCMMGKPEEHMQQHYEIGPENKVGNVYVWVMPADSKASYFEFTKEQIDAMKLKNITIKQPHCAFIPHVDLAFVGYANADYPKKKKTVPTGQTVEVFNDAVISHNTMWEDTPKIPKGNQLLAHDKSLTLPLVPESVPVEIRCSIHPWMNAFIWSLSHPYADITKSPTSPAMIEASDSSYGTYEIKNVPAGKLKIVAWHEEAKFLTPDRKMASAETIELKEGEALTKDFEMEAPKQ